MSITGCREAAITPLAQHELIGTYQSVGVKPEHSLALALDGTYVHKPSVGGQERRQHGTWTSAAKGPCTDIDRGLTVTLNQYAPLGLPTFTPARSDMAIDTTVCARPTQYGLVILEMDADATQYFRKQRAAL